jgi:hypothetical protein
MRGVRFSYMLSRKELHIVWLVKAEIISSSKRNKNEEKDPSITNIHKKTKNEFIGQ